MLSYERIDAQCRFRHPAEANRLRDILERNRFGGILFDAESPDEWDAAKAEPMVRGILARVNDPAEEQWWNDPSIVAAVWKFDRSGAHAWSKRRHTLELIVPPDQVDAAVDFVSHSVETPVVLRLPAVVPEQQWQRLGAIPAAFVKLAGLIDTAAPHAQQVEQIRPFVQSALAFIGPERLIFGSDWPRCLDAANWKEVLAAFTQACGPQPMSVREELLGGSARRAYRLESEPA